MELKNFFVLDDQGNTLPGATCYLYERGTESLVNVLEGANGLPLNNPFMSDQQGLVQFAAPNGLYDLRAVKGKRDNRILLQFNDVTETAEAAEAAARALQIRLADPYGQENGAQLSGYRGETVYDALSRFMTPSQFRASTDRDDTESFKRMHLAALRTKIKPLILLNNIYQISGGFEQTLYEWADTTFFSHGAVINADALTGDNGVLQIGSRTRLVGHLDINITNTEPGNSGFVRTGMTIGRWWNAANRVEHFSVESVRITTSTGANCVAISGSARKGSLGRIGCYGSFAIGVLIHWSGLPNDRKPEITYHPNAIEIDEIYGSGASSEGLLTISNGFSITVRRLAGNDNNRNFFCIAGDWGSTYANEEEFPFLGRGIKVEEFACTNTRTTGVQIIGQTGLISGHNLDMPVELGTGYITGAKNSVYGILHSNVDGGKIGDLEVSGFYNGVMQGANVKNVIHRGTRSTKNRGNGFRISGVADVRKGTVLDHVVSKNNNTQLAPGVAEIEIGGTADGIHIINPQLSTDNTVSPGLRLTGTAKNCIVDAPVGAGFKGERYVVINDCGPNNNNIIRNIRGDSTNLLTPSSTPVLIRIDSIGRRVFAADAIPMSGSFVQGDIVEFNRPSLVGFSGAACSSSGTPGTWRRFGALEA